MIVNVDSMVTGEAKLASRKVAGSEEHKTLVYMPKYIFSCRNILSKYKPEMREEVDSLIYQLVM